MTQQHDLLRRLRAVGLYGSDQEAGRILDTVLTMLGGQVVGEERCDLAAVLPEPARSTFASQLPLVRPVAGPAFVEAVARTLNCDLTSARWHTASVLAVLAEVGGETLTDRLVAQLPRSWALLFGRADLTAAA
ncbi:DUF2267 domain-containing protein [Streptacidiphilus monticola]|jgi:uncharacterized protein (DUF2267 family)|uniref:DUF2267 domain-containing protein n=1 Tax=Streptacidiphilus monticola TaxID=2161674 RepID=A0ABW1G5G6_9ACTN